MKNVFFEGRVLWSQIDANMHLRHSAYADFAAQARLQILESLGFNANLLEELKIGPILFREELIYMREVRPSDTVKVTCELTHCRRDGSRWSFTQALYRGDGVQAAQINVQGAWVDMVKRKLAALPEEWAKTFLQIPKSENFVLEEVPEKKPEPMINTSNMTDLEKTFEDAKKRVMELPEKQRCDARTIRLEQTGDDRRHQHRQACDVRFCGCCQIQCLERQKRHQQRRRAAEVHRLRQQPL
jgi:acyl-CoA thioester hydrolase